MNYKLVLFLFAVTIFECNGHLPILGDIISSTKDKIQSTVEGVAGALLGGFNLNFGGHFGINKQPPQDVPQRNPEETVIVVVEENNDDNNRPLNNNNYGPIDHGHRPHHHPRPGYNDHNQEAYNQNSYHQNPSHQGNGNNFYENNQNGRPNDQNNPNYNNNGYFDNQFDQNNPNRPVEHQTNHQNPYNGNGNGNTEQLHNKPTTEYIQTTVGAVHNSLKDDKNNEVTEKPSDDLPLFIPLNTGEYVYGGDKINITAPKRDTEKAKQESEDDDFPIDVRFKND